MNTRPAAATISTDEAPGFSMSRFGAPLDAEAASDQPDTEARQAIRRLRAAALVLALLIAIALPAMRGYVGSQAIEQAIDEETEQLADRMSERASAAPQLWLHEVAALTRLVDNPIEEGTLSAVRLVGTDGRNLLTVGPWEEDAWFEEGFAVYDAGVVVATLHGQRDHRPLVASVLESAVFSVVLALATYLLLARVAVRSIEQTVRRLQDARRDAVRAGEARTVFLATMSHEIRTPMNGVVGMTSLLRDTPLTDQQRHYVDVIRGSGESLLRVINDILEFTKVESGHARLEPVRFQPEQLGEEVLVLLEPLSRHKDMKLHFEVAPGTPRWVLADVNRLRQVLVNLVGNAIKFSERGTVRLRVESTAADRLSFSVSDEGIGISAEQLQSIFNPFVQADASTSRRFGGTGLGLAISRRLAETMGGRIEVESTLGQGSRFTVCVHAPAAVAPDGDELETGVEALVGKRVLLVDDNPVNLEIVETMARSWGMVPRALTDPQRAVEWAGDAQNGIDVAVLDFNMPGIDGHALARRIRALRPGVPLVLLSSKNGAVHDEGLFDARLNKPVLRTLLRDTLRSVLTRTPVQEPDTLSQSALAGLRHDVGVPALHSLRVLVAEDNAVNAMVISAMLERLGVVSERACNGLEAVQAVERQPYDVVLMDMLMPELDGLDATRRVRANATLVQPRIVALTANVMSEDRARCVEAGMDDFLAKPLQLPELERCLSRFAAARDRR